MDFETLKHLHQTGLELCINLILWILKPIFFIDSITFELSINLILWILKHKYHKKYKDINVPYKFDPMDFETQISKNFQQK